MWVTGLKHRMFIHRHRASKKKEKTKQSNGRKTSAVSKITVSKVTKVQNQSLAYIVNGRAVLKVNAAQCESIYARIAIQQKFCRIIKTLCNYYKCNKCKIFIFIFIRHGNLLKKRKQQKKNLSIAKLKGYKKM